MRNLFARWHGFPVAALIVMSLGVAACVRTTPEPECSTASWSVEPTLGCRAAVDVALELDAVRDQQVERIEFAWGDYCPPNERCLLADPSRGYVLFTFTNTARQAYVAVGSGASGAATRLSDLIWLDPA